MFGTGIEWREMEFEMVEGRSKACAFRDSQIDGQVWDRRANWALAMHNQCSRMKASDRGFYGLTQIRVKLLISSSTERTWSNSRINIPTAENIWPVWPIQTTQSLFFITFSQTSFARIRSSVWCLFAIADMQSRKRFFLDRKPLKDNWYNHEVVFGRWLFRQEEEAELKLRDDGLPKRWEEFARARADLFLSSSRLRSPVCM